MPRHWSLQGHRLRTMYFAYRQPYCLGRGGGHLLEPGAARNCELRSFPLVFPWLPYPIESFGFGLIPPGLSPPRLGGVRNGLRQLPGLSEEVKDGEAYNLKYIHKVAFV